MNDFITIPENTKITVILPNDAEVLKESLSSLAKVNGSTIVLEAMSTNSVKMKYVIKKPISPATGEFKLSDILKNDLLVKSAIALFAVIALFGLFRRKQIKEKLENYVVNHTEFEKSEKADDEIDA